MNRRHEQLHPVRTLEAVVKAPGERPRVTVIADTLEAMQSIVGGYIEIVGFTEENVIVCNEEGRLLNLPENALGLRGTFIALGRGSGDGELGSVVRPKDVVAQLDERPWADA